MNGITRSKYLVAVLAVLVCGALSATAVALPATAAQQQAVAAATPLKIAGGGGRCLRALTWCAPLAALPG